MKTTPKDFDGWNKLKKTLENQSRNFFAHPRDVWWCSLGVNLGMEVDGKNENYERPVVVLKVYNRHTLLVAPITSKPKSDRFHFCISIQQREKGSGPSRARSVWVKLTQIRVISIKRLVRKVDIVPETEFEKLSIAVKMSISV